MTNINPWRALFNDFFWHELVHMYLAGYIVVGFVVASDLRRRDDCKGDRSDYVRAGLIIPLTVAALVAPVQLFVGDWAGARRRARTSRSSSPRSKGLGQTRRARRSRSAGYYDDDTDEINGGIPIPDMLSLLAFHDPERHGRRVSTACRPRTGPGRSTPCASPSTRWSGSARCWRCSARLLSVRLVARKRLPPTSAGSIARSSPAGPGR